MTTPPSARTTDPTTSHLAAMEVAASGQAKRQKDICLEAVRRHPGRNAKYIGRITELGHVPAQRRLSELKAEGVIRQGDPVRENGRLMMTWWPPDQQIQLF